MGRLWSISSPGCWVNLAKNVLHILFLEFFKGPVSLCLFLGFSLKLFLPDLNFIGNVDGSVGEQSLLFFFILEFPRDWLVTKNVSFSHIEWDTLVVSRFIESIVDQL